MKEVVSRGITKQVLNDLTYFPVVGIIGPRQVGKTTLAKIIQKNINKPTIYLDLELESDLRKLQNAEGYLKLHMDECVIIDEIQRMPSLFPLLRALVDLQKEPARFIILGSASPGLIRDASETLAGRIAYSELTPFGYLEVKDIIGLRKHWLVGGFPDAMLAPDMALSWRWLESFAKTFIERDLRELGHEISPPFLKRMLSMLGHLHGQLLNVSSLSRSLAISQPTVRKYLDLLEGGFVINRLQPFHKNIGKRLVKSPKIYIRDSGLLHSLSNITELEQLYGHILVGASWEGYVIEQIRRTVGSYWEFYFYRTHGKAEADLVLIGQNGEIGCIEIKYSSAPSASKGFFQTLTDLRPRHKIIIVPEGESYPLNESVWVHSLPYFLENIIPKW